MRGHTERLRRGMAAVLGVSMAATALLLMLEGRWREVIPLHLCSVSALCALGLALRPRAVLLDFLWYLGMPGAALALLFPAPAVCRHQALLNASYTATHAMILIIPGVLMGLGMRPRRGRAPEMLLALQGLALCAAGVNSLLGTDFLFLAAPPAGTPLERVFALGYAPYLIVLEAMMLALCMAMDALAGRAEQNDRQ